MSRQVLASTYNFNDFKESGVLVTGASGFIGRHLVAALSSNGASVLKFSSRESADQHSIQGDVTKLNEVAAAFEQSHKTLGRPINYVFHLAGQKSPALSKQYPRESLELALLGSLNILEVARQQSASIRRVVLVSSLAVYGMNEDQSVSPMKEDNGLDGDSIYSVGKIATEYIAKAYCHDLQVPATIARLANVYGPGQSTEAVIATVIKQILSKQDLSLGNTSSVRDFIYVEDVAEALMVLALAEGVQWETFNVGSGHAYSVDDVVRCLAGLMGFDGEIRTETDRVRVNERSVLVPDVGALIGSKRWAPRFSLAAGLAQTVEAFTNEAGV